MCLAPGFRITGRNFNARHHPYAVLPASLYCAGNAGKGVVVSHRNGGKPAGFRHKNQLLGCDCSIRTGRMAMQICSQSIVSFLQAR
jgi:hypothetical protein